jgi:hypothetical protein
MHENMYNFINDVAGVSVYTFEEAEEVIYIKQKQQGG